MNWKTIATALRNISLALDCYAGNGGYAGPKAVSISDQAELLRAISQAIADDPSLHHSLADKERP